MTLSLFALIPLLIYLGFFIFIVYVVVTILKLMRQKNEYLKEIRDELRINNSVN